MKDNKIQRKIRLASEGLTILYKGLDDPKFDKLRSVMFDCICALGSCYFWVEEAEDYIFEEDLDKLISWLRKQAYST